jgi:hypothetical protein
VGISIDEAGEAPPTEVDRKRAWTRLEEAENARARLGPALIGGRFRPEAPPMGPGFDGVDVFESVGLCPYVFVQAS